MNIVIADPDHEAHPAVDAAGLTATPIPCGTQDDLIQGAQGAGIILAGPVDFTADGLAALPDLRLIVRLAPGGTIDWAAARRMGVAVSDPAEADAPEAADHAIALTLTLLRKIPAMTAATRSGIWDHALARPLRRHSELTVGLIGAGPVGMDYATKMGALGFRTLVHDPLDITGAVLGDVIELSDVIAVFALLTEATRDLLDAAMFDRMKTGVYVISLAEGGILDEDALAEALRTGKVAGAGIDRTRIEPLPADSALREFDTCLITPHMAWYSEDAVRDLHRRAAEEAVRFARGEPILWPAPALEEPT
ncbi:NAD(P)-dependent oxidoreductase [Falsirhodobacter halotolerans]|uniref:NAD(P)-dependent oxidoreductase n=1 Tax=Falsirhodobacter halotolerans TaxID=1146892 RepID=UPI001FD2152C|nr:NAD(P)-dependent oxidoreductase [Falsirhodobacter halotolerans]MCJ8139248.1 hypothetical protein [Falsirhodobacter halotolerans]